MIVIGITGSIGMGKSTIASMLKTFNIPIFDSDYEVKHILEKDKFVMNKIEKIWPDVILLELGHKKIDKVVLGNKIFEDKKKRKQLEKIIHPIIKQKRIQFLKNHNKYKIVGLDVPLLYETKTNEICNFVFLANTSKKIQQKRVLKRSYMTKKKFELINDVQWSYEKKKKFNPFIIETSFGRLYSFVQLIMYLIIIVVKRQDKND